MPCAECEATYNRKNDSRGARHLYDKCLNAQPETV